MTIIKHIFAVCKKQRNNTAIPHQYQHIKNMYKFYQNLREGLFFEITLDTDKCSLLTKRGKFKWYYRGDGKENTKSYKKLETAQRNFEKICKEWEAKAYLLSDPFRPLAYQNAINNAKTGSNSLSVEIYKPENFDEIVELTHLTDLRLSGEKGGLQFAHNRGGSTSPPNQNQVIIPQSITKLKNLEYLAIKHQIGNLPENIGEFKKLKRFYMYECRNITAFPDSIGDCESLEKIDMSCHSAHIPTLPDSIGKLKKLRKLDCQYSKIQKLPEAIGKCIGLEEVILEDCDHISDLPDSFGDLPNLKILNIEDSGFTHFPECITRLKSLEELNFGQNALGKLPENIGDLTNLRILDLSSCQISKLPDSFCKLINLEELNLGGNQLKELPKGFENLTKLKELKLWGNDFKDLPDEVIQQGKRAVFAHYGWLGESEQFTVEHDLSDEEIKELRVRYDERISRFEKKWDKDHYRVAPIDKICQFLRFESDDIPNIEKTPWYYRRGAMPYFKTIFAPIDEWTEVEHRMMLILTQNDWGTTSPFKTEHRTDQGWCEPFFDWYVESIKNGAEISYESMFDVLKKHGKEEDAFEALLAHTYKFLVTDYDDPKARMFGKYVIERFKENPKEFLSYLANDQDNYEWREMANYVINLISCCALKDFEPYVDEWFFELRKLSSKEGKIYYPFRIWNIHTLCDLDPKKYEDFLLKVIELNDQQAGIYFCAEVDAVQCAFYLDKYYKGKHNDIILDQLKKYLGFMMKGEYSYTYTFAYEMQKADILEWALKLFKKELKDIVFEVIQNKPEVCAEYLGVVTKIYKKDAVPLFEAFLHRKIDLATVIPLLEKHDYSPFHDKVWNFLKDDKKAIRQIGVKELVRLYKEKELLEKASDYLTAKKATNRFGGLELLMELKSKKSIAHIKERFIEETNNDLRNTMLTFLVEAGEQKYVKKELINAYQWAKEKGKLKKPPRKWLENARLGDLYWKNGKKADKEFAFYLFHRQKDKAQAWHEPTKEVALLLEELDQEKCVDFAKKLLNTTLKNGGLKSTNKAVLSIISNLGRNEVVDELKPIAKRANTVAPRMLGNIISEKSARALDEIILHFKTKYPNVRGAAQEAFDNIAEQMGLSRFQLMDKMVPDFGFVGLFKELEVNGENWKAFIGADLKLAFLNESDEIKKKLPTKASKEVKATVKELNQEIRSIARNQKNSMEHSLITQRRWSVDEWQAHFMQKPLTFAFAQSLVWGIYEKGKLTSTFGVSQDQTLENTNMEEVQLPPKAMIGMVHPVELKKTQIKEWQQYLLENEIKQVFEQIERQVIEVPRTQVKETIINQFKDKEISDYRFRSIMGRRGWKRGSVVDGGMIDNYKKVYESLGVEVFVSLEEMYVYLGEYSEEVKLQEVYFVKAGTVETGSYVYDTYKNDEDERLISLGKLPPIVYSETMYDFEVLLEQSKEA